MNENIAWTIAGSDTSASAGIQADLKTFQNLGVHGCSIITALTAQDDQEIRAIEFINSDFISSEIEVLQNQYYPKAIKIGMLGQISTINVMHNFLEHYSGYVVLDPVITATSGKHLYNCDLSTYLVSLKTLIKHIHVFTPNLFEAEMLLERQLDSTHDIEQAAYDIIRLGAKSVLIKGGHFKNDRWSQDYWTDGNTAFWLSNKKLRATYRGSGCTMSAAITAALSFGYEIKDALVIAKMYIHQCFRHSKTEKSSNTNTVKSWPEDQVDLPYLSSQVLKQEPRACKAYQSNRIEIYPIVENKENLAMLLQSGVRLLQLRIKNKSDRVVEQEIKQSIEIARRFNAILYINDYWELALHYQADGVHLGQSDLQTLDINELQRAGLALGISTHCYHEIARAHTFKPSYIAFGPIYHTTSKLMPFTPQGLVKLQQIRRTLEYPLVAIGGINENNLSFVLESKVNAVAMISAISKAPDPGLMTQKLLTMVDQYATKS